MHTKTSSPAQLQVPCCPEILQARDALARAREREQAALSMLRSLQNISAVPVDIRYANDRVDAAAQVRSQLEHKLRMTISKCTQSGFAPYTR